MCTGPVHYCSALGTHLIMGHTIILWLKENPELLTPIVKFAINALLFSSQLMHTENVSLRKKNPPKNVPISDPFRNRATPISVPIQRARMNGLLLPHRRVQRSLAEPIRGVNKRPRTGLRNHVRL